jgi:hypothetical protein
MNPTTNLIDLRSRARTASDGRSPLRHTSVLTTQLDREWERMHRDPRAIRTTQEWVATGLVRRGGALADALADLADLDVLIAATQRTDHRPGVAGRQGDPDQILLELLAVARLQQLAGRILLQRILPGLLSRSHHYVEPGFAHRIADIVIAAAWEAIHAYDYERRPRAVAAALISDAVFAAFRQPHRRRSATERVRPIESWARQAADPSSEPLQELAEIVAEAQRCGVDRHHLDLLRGLVRTGSTALVADELGVTARTIRARRDRAVIHVREAVLAA